MKPTQKQIELIKTVRGIVSSWASTNDLSSPTHHSDIKEELDKFSDEDNEFYDNHNMVLDITEYLSAILYQIQQYDREDKKT